MSQQEASERDTAPTIVEPGSAPDNDSVSDVEAARSKHPFKKFMSALPHSPRDIRSGVSKMRRRLGGSDDSRSLAVKPAEKAAPSSPLPVSDNDFEGAGAAAEDDESAPKQKTSRKTSKKKRGMAVRSPMPPMDNESDSSDAGGLDKQRMREAKLEQKIDDLNDVLDGLNERVKTEDGLMRRKVQLEINAKNKKLDKYKAELEELTGVLQGDASPSFTRRSSAQFLKGLGKGKGQRKSQPQALNSSTLAVSNTAEAQPTTPKRERRLPRSYSIDYGRSVQAKRFSADVEDPELLSASMADEVSSAEQRRSTSPFTRRRNKAMSPSNFSDSRLAVSPGSSSARTERSASPRQRGVGPASPTSIHSAEVAGSHRNITNATSGRPLSASGMVIVRTPTIDSNGSGDAADTNAVALAVPRSGSRPDIGADLSTLPEDNSVKSPPTGFARSMYDADVKDMDQLTSQGQTEAAASSETERFKRFIGGAVNLSTALWKKRPQQAAAANEDKGLAPAEAKKGHRRNRSQDLTAAKGFAAPATDASSAAHVSVEKDKQTKFRNLVTKIMARRRNDSEVSNNVPANNAPDSRTGAACPSSTPETEEDIQADIDTLQLYKEMVEEELKKCHEEHKATKAKLDSLPEAYNERSDSVDDVARRVKQCERTHDKLKTVCLKLKRKLDTNNQALTRLLDVIDKNGQAIEQCLNTVSRDRERIDMELYRQKLINGFETSTEEQARHPSDITASAAPKHVETASADAESEGTTTPYSAGSRHSSMSSSPRFRQRASSFPQAAKNMKSKVTYARRQLRLMDLSSNRTRQNMVTGMLVLLVCLWLVRLMFGQPHTTQ